MSTTDPALAPVSSAVDPRARHFAALEHVNQPVWVLDIEQRRMHWANAQAVQLWNAASLAELCARDMGTELSASVVHRLARYRSEFVARVAVSVVAGRMAQHQLAQVQRRVDEAVQQNAALVEESAAAAESLKVQALQLVQAVAVFKLAHGEETRTPTAIYAPAPAAAPAATERRGPARAKNVTRPQFGAKAKAATPTAEAAPAKTGTDDGWASF